MTPAGWLWIPITVSAAFAQTLRNAAQRHLSKELGTLGATLVRFLYGLPFAALWLFTVRTFGDLPMPDPGRAFPWWLLLGSISQIAATAWLLRAMAERNFTLGVAYSKSEIIQVAVFGFVFLGDPLTTTAALAIGFGTIGVLLLAPVDRGRPIRAVLSGWTTRPALLGLASGAGFAMSAVGYRGAALALDTPFMLAAAFTLLGAQLLQSVLLCGWLAVYRKGVITRVLRAWRTSLFAGFMGATASAGWFTAMAIEPVAHVRTLALIELIFSYAVSRRIFREKFDRLQIIGMGVLVLGLIIVALAD